MKQREKDWLPVVRATMAQKRADFIEQMRILKNEEGDTFLESVGTIGWYAGQMEHDSITSDDFMTASICCLAQIALIDMMNELDDESRNDD